VGRSRSAAISGAARSRSSALPERRGPRAARSQGSAIPEWRAPGVAQSRRGAILEWRNPAVGRSRRGAIPGRRDPERRDPGATPWRRDITATRPRATERSYANGVVSHSPGLHRHSRGYPGLRPTSHFYPERVASALPMSRSANPTQSPAIRRQREKPDHTRRRSLRTNRSTVAQPFQGSFQKNGHTTPGHPPWRMPRGCES